jgi:nitrate reductase NapE component
MPVKIRRVISIINIEYSFLHTFTELNTTTMSDKRGQLPDNYDLNDEAKVEKKRKSKNILFATVVIGIILIAIAIAGGYITFPDVGKGKP